MTPAQLSTLKTAIIAHPVAGPMRAAGDTVSLLAWCNGDSATVVWRSLTSADAIGNAVIWAAMTPAMPPDGTALWTNRALYAQAKQISLQTLLQGRQTVATGVAGIRNGLEDCLTQLPTSLDGSNRAAGWSSVRLVMQRFATNAEDVFDSGAGTAVAPSDLGWEGQVSQAEANLLVN